MRVENTFRQIEHVDGVGASSRTSDATLCIDFFMGDRFVYCDYISFENNGTV